VEQQLLREAGVQRRNRDAEPTQPVPMIPTRVMSGIDPVYAVLESSLPELDRRFLGSTTNQVVRRAACLVLTIRR
jgi:nucleotide-binding universal stress UspA family protein